TPVVEVVKVAAMADSLAQPLFLTVTFRLTHSFLLMTPLLLPLTESSTASALNWRFELPVMQKPCVAVPPLATVTPTVAGEPIEQLRSESAALAVYVPAGTE